MSAELAHLPVSPAPIAGEAIDSYLERLADANGITHPALCRRVRSGGASTAFLAIAPDEQLIGALAKVSTVPTIELESQAVNALPGINTHGLDPASKKSWRTVAARGWPPEHGSALCAACLAADGPWRLAWRHPWVTACVRHRTWLLNTCPGCRQRFRSHRTPLRPVDAPAGTCGNPGGTRGHNCPQPLAELRGEQAASEVLPCQQRIDAALAGQRVEILGTMVGASAYLLELKALTVLLLHLAIQPGGDNLAAWAVAARADRARSAGDRSARWALTPPADLQLRGLSIADADAILRASDAEAAAEALHPWTELTPPTNDGQLGWLADHTTMTPTLTRLVMSATAARRRIATLLDNPPTCAVPVAAIPQVLTADLYTTRLCGMLDVTERTGRLFASLCLSRRYGGAGTWAEAATALGLPAPTGVKTARACSADLLVRPDTFIAALDSLAPRLDPDVDYRARESAVRHLAETIRWYRRWARTHHPGSRTASSGYAVTWLWTEYAHGHIDNSPSWEHPPDRHGRARCRAYAARLDPDAGHALTELARTTTTTTARRTA